MLPTAVREDVVSLIEAVLIELSDFAAHSGAITRWLQSR